MRQFSKSLYAAAVVVLGAATACSNDSTGPSASTSLSPSEARVVASALFGNIAAAVGSQTPASATIPATQSTTAAPTFTANINATCSSGGTLKGTYIFNNDVNAAGTGTKSGSITVTASQCVVNTGERTLTTDGSYTFTFGASFTNNILSSNFVWKAGGNFTWTGGSCALDYTVEVKPNGARTLTGTVCGVDVTGTAT